jgi:hypothetical protein
MMQRLTHWLGPVWVDRTTRRLLIASVAVNVLAWALILVRLWPFVAHNRLISLHYSIYIGVNDVGPAFWALLTPFVGLLAVFVNTAFARLFYVRERMIALVFFSITFVYEVLTLVSAVFVVLINLHA